MRIEGVDIANSELDPKIKQVLDGQNRKWGAPLENQLVYARIPSIFHGAQGMWRGLGAARRLDPVLSALVNRRVAMLNGCVF